MDYTLRQKKQWGTKRKNGTDVAWNKGMSVKVKKNCLSCGKEMVVYNSQEYCSKKCCPIWNKGLKGYHPKGVGFKKGVSTWNKGKHIQTNNALEVWRLNGGKPPHTGKKRPELTGEKNHMWKGGITPERNKIRSSPEYRIWKYAVFARDNFTCQNCYKRGGNLNAHHIKGFATHPELRFAIDNGLTLCEPCHKKHRKHK